MLAADGQTQNLLIIGSYRDNEVSVTHPLAVTLDDLQKSRIAIKTIMVQALQRKDVHALVSETLHSDDDQTEPLADLVHEKTAGNAFFVNQFLRSLHDDGLIVFDSAADQWTWNLNQINERSMSDNVLIFMAEKIQKFDPATQRILIQAACIGHQFEMDLLSVVSGEPPATVMALLWPALRDGLILPIETGTTSALTNERTPSTNDASPPATTFRFLHDRVSQAAYSLIDDEERRQLHLSIGRMLLETLERQGDRLFDVVNHLNYGIEFIVDPAERLRIAEMNLLAGQKAKASTAYAAARDYLSAGMQYLPENVWEQHYELALEYYKQRSECEYLAGNFDTAEAYLAVVLQRAHTNLEKLEAYLTQITLYTNLANFAQAKIIGLEAMREVFGVELVEDTSLQERVAAMMAAIPEQMQGRTHQDLLKSPPLTDPERLAEVQYLVAMLAPSYNTNPTLLSYMMLRGVAISLTQGHAPESPLCYAMFGLICARSGDYDTGHAYGQLALALSQQSHVNLQGKVFHIAAYLISHWREHIRSTVEYEKQAYLRSLEVGDFVYAGLAAWARLKYLLLAGAELNDLFGEIEHYIAFARQSKNYGLLSTATLTQNMIRALRGETEARDRLDYETFDEATFLADMNSQGLLLISNLYYLYKLQLFNLYGDYQRAYEIIPRAEATIAANVGSYLVPDLVFWSALTLTGLYATASDEDQAVYKARLDEHLAQLRTWSDNCPENHLGKYLLVQAEMLRIGGDHKTALDLYDQAITACRAQGFTHHEGIANELAARFFLSRGQEKVARVYLTDARHAFVIWGATAKVQQLEEMYQALFPTAPLSSRNHDTTTVKGSTTSHSYTTTTEQNGWLDVVTVIKAAQAISETIVFETLLHTLMHIMLENAGAQNGVLMIERDGALIVAAESRMEQEALAILANQAQPANDRRI